VPNKPTIEIISKNMLQNISPPMILVVTMLVDKAYPATDIRIIDKSFYNIQFYNKANLFKVEKKWLQ